LSSFSPNPFNFLPENYILPDAFSEEFIVKLREYLNTISINNNTKDSAFYITDELASGGLFIPTFGNTKAQNATYRAMYRKVIEFGALPNTATKSVAHGITTTENYSFIKIYGGATDPGVSTITSTLPLPFASPTLNENIKVDVDATNVNITTGIDRTAYTRSYIILEYIKEV